MWPCLCSIALAKGEWIAVLTQLVLVSSCGAWDRHWFQSLLSLCLLVNFMMGEKAVLSSRTDVTLVLLQKNIYDEQRLYLSFVVYVAYVD